MTLNRIRVPLIVGVLTLSSCSALKTQAPAEPELNAERTADIEAITIMGTNDIHGTILPLQLKTKDANPVSYESGGVAWIASYAKKLRKDLGDRFLWLDGGDEFQGSIESNLNRGSAMVSFFNTAGLNAAAIGNHEFDFGPDPENNPDRTSSLKHHMMEAHYPYLAANVYDKESGKLAGFPNTLPSKIFQTGRIKVGVIGLSTVETPTTTRSTNVVDLKFGDLKSATLREAKSLRAAGADVILITAHVGLYCDVGHSSPGHKLRHLNDPQGDCDRSDEMVRLLSSLPSGTVDAVVSGHSHTIVHHFVNGVPVIQGGATGRYFNLIHLFYDLKAHHLMSDRSVIEGPIPVCPKIFKNQGDCNGDRPAPAIGRGKLVTPTFRHTDIKADSDVEAAVEPAIEAAKQLKKEVYGQAVNRIEHVRERESQLGNLVADSVREATHADFALVNAGGIRASIEQGAITYGDIFRALPFDNSLVVLTVTGKQLKHIVQIGESGSRGFHPISGLRVRLISPEADAPAEDLNRDGRIEPWEINRLISVETTAGDEIEDRKEYKIATIDFLVTGGDDYGWIMKQIPESKRLTTGFLVRDVAASYIKKMSAAQGGLNSAEHPLINPAAPRLVFEKPKPPKKGKKHRRKKKKKTSKP